MSDLISRQKAIEAIDKYFDDLPIQGYYDMLQLINNLPTIDAVPVVRCRDCEFWGTHLRTYGDKYGECLRHWRGTRADFYCGFGSRSDETN